MKKIFLLFGLILTVIVSSTNFTMAQHRKMSSQAKGALIGGAIGAGGGYVIGNEHRRNKAKRNAYYRSSHRSSRYYSRRRYN
jgi:hypothetical protein